VLGVCVLISPFNPPPRRLEKDSTGWRQGQHCSSVCPEHQGYSLPMADIHHIQRILLIIESIQTELFCSRSSFSPIVSRLSRLHHSNLVTVYVGMYFSFGCRSGHLACPRRTDGMDGRDSSSVAHTDRNVLMHSYEQNQFVSIMSCWYWY
jgi:hypothetical protein